MKLNIKAKGEELLGAILTSAGLKKFSQNKKDNNSGISQEKK